MPSTRSSERSKPKRAKPGIVSPERPTGLVEGDRFDVSIGTEVVAWKYFYHLPFYRQQDHVRWQRMDAQSQYTVEH